MPVSRKRRFCLAWPYNKSFIDRASPVKMLNISLVFFGVFMDVNFLSLKTSAI